MIILIIHIIVSYDQNISLIFYVNDRSHVKLRHPSCFYISAQRQYSAVLKMCTLLKWLPCLTSLRTSRSTYKTYRHKTYHHKTYHRKTYLFKTYQNKTYLTTKLIKTKLIKLQNLSKQNLSSQNLLNYKTYKNKKYQPKKHIKLKTY